MTVGEGIFWGALIIAVVGLYATTKDRWRWRRIAKWGFGVPVVSLVLGGLGTWAVNIYEERVKPIDTFGGVSLASSESDVRFAKGEPSRVLEKGLWVYYSGSGSAQLHAAGYAVRFKDGKVRYVSYVANEDQIVNPRLHGFTMGATYASVLDKLGPPDHVASSDDGLQRIASYDRLKTFYTFERAAVRELGIFDPAQGPLLFVKATSTPQSPASAPARAAPSESSAPPKATPARAPNEDHCAPGISRAERLKRLAQHGTVRETAMDTYDAGESTIVFGYEGVLVYCR